MKIVVFLGPSMSREAAEEILPAIYLPPAAQSDLMSSVRIHKPDIIALIDGVFLSRPSVWHKEILYALENGVAVYGASSMGALRAAETKAFGAIGVGRIFRMYSEEGLLDDDEVALSHADAEFGFRPLTEPMVNFRATAQRALDEGVLDRSEHEQLVKVAKAQHFTQRTVGSVLAQSGFDEARRNELRSFFRDSYVDLKRSDAEELLRHLAQLEVAPTPPSLKVEDTAYHVRQYSRERLVQRKAAQIPLERIAYHYALHSEEFEQTYFDSLNRMLVQVMAKLMEVEVSPEDLRAERRRLRLGLRVKEDELSAWMAENDINQDEFDELVRQRATCRVMHRWMMREGYRATKGTPALLDELRLRGLYPKWADSAAETTRKVTDRYPTFPSREHDLEMRELVLDQIRSTPARMTLPYDRWYKESGFSHESSLKMELARERLAREVDKELILGSAGRREE